MVAVSKVLRESGFVNTEIIVFSHLFLSFFLKQYTGWVSAITWERQGSRGGGLSECSLIRIIVKKAPVWPVLNYTCGITHLECPDLWQIQTYLPWCHLSGFPVPLKSSTFHQLCGETQLSDFCLHISHPKHTNFYQESHKFRRYFPGDTHCVQAQITEYIWFYTATFIWLFNF